MLTQEYLEDERSIANKIESESKRENEQEQEKTLEDELHKKDATLPVRSTLDGTLVDYACSH